MTHIKELAEAVQGWENCTEAWLDTSEDDSAAVVGHIDEDGNAYPVAVVDCAQYYAEHDSMKLARFYAAANPTAVLELLAESDQLRQQLSEAQAEALEQARIVGMGGEREIDLRKQVTLLRDEVTRCRDWFETQANVTSKGGPSSWELMLLRDERDAADKALAATEPKP